MGSQSNSTYIPFKPVQTIANFVCFLFRFFFLHQFIFNISCAFIVRNMYLGNLGLISMSDQTSISTGEVTVFFKFSTCIARTAYFIVFVTKPSACVLKVLVKILVSILLSSIREAVSTIIYWVLKYKVMFFVSSFCGDGSGIG